jgi:uncharacterized membrane protein
MYNITVTNWGEVPENYFVEYIPDGWPEENIYIEPPVLYNVPPGGENYTMLWVHVPDNENIPPCTKKELIVVVTSFDLEVGDNDSVIAHVDYPEPPDNYEKENMPDLGQHCINWCWTAAAANSFKWYAHHGYPELLDDPEHPGPDNWYWENWIHPCPNDPWCPENRYSRLLLEIAADCGRGWNEPVTDNDFFYGLRKFISDQGALLYVHEIVDNSYFVGLGEPIPREDGRSIIYDEPTFDNYKRELWRCQDVLLQLPCRNRSDDVKEPPYEEQMDHIVTGVSFYDGGPGNQWIEVSDPWTTPPGWPQPDHNNQENVYENRYENLLVLNEDPLIVQYTWDNFGTPVPQPVPVVKLIYISPIQCHEDVIALPRLENGAPSEELIYDITVTNWGNVIDSFHLSYIPNGWPEENIWFENEQLENIDLYDEMTTKLHVRIPDWAENCTEKEIIVVATSKTCHENDNDSVIAHVVVVPVRDVLVSISPGVKEGVPCTTLVYTVIVQNTGDIDDTYDLSVSDNAGWGAGISLDDSSLWVAHGDENSTKLRVHVPDNATPCTWVRITVTATSQADPTVSDSDSCRAHAVSVVRSVEVSISPYENWAVPGENVTFTVTITNTGNVSDSYTLENVDNQGWALTLPSSTGSINAGASVNKTLQVTIPETAENCTRDNITVTATSQTDNTIENSDSCIAHCLVGVPPLPKRGVRVSISPQVQDGRLGRTLGYTVTITNTGTITDTYTLSRSDTEGWGLVLPSSSGPLAPGASVDKTLKVTIPLTAENCTSDNITVTATSSENLHVSAENSCIAHAVFVLGPGVNVLILPSEKEGTSGENVTFTVTVTNIGDTEDNYDLSASDTEGWALGLPSSVGPLENGASAEVTLEVAIPDDAENCTQNSVTVTATSQENTEITDNDSSIAHVVVVLPVREVSVSISPSEKEGAPGDTLEYTVTVTNTGDMEDSYTPENSDTAGWTLSLSSDTVGPLDPDESTTVTLEVTIPSDVEDGDSTTVTVTATSQADPSVDDSDTCTARAEVPPPGLPGWVPVAIGVVIIVLAIIAILVFGFPWWWLLVAILISLVLSLIALLL